MRRPSLRLLLTLPFGLLVLVAAALTLWQAKQTSQQALDQLAEQLLRSSVQHIVDTVQRELQVSGDVLGQLQPLRPGTDPLLDAPAFHEQLWRSTRLGERYPRYAYYGDQQGRFFGLMRIDPQQGELRRQLVEGGGPRLSHLVRSPDQGLREPAASAIAQALVG
jgi:hypothetical protein